MAHLDPAGAARDRAVEAMELCWRDLSDRYDRQPLPAYETGWPQAAIDEDDDLTNMAVGSPMYGHAVTCAGLDHCDCGALSRRVQEFKPDDKDLYAHWCAERGIEIPEHFRWDEPTLF